MSLSNDPFRNFIGPLAHLRPVARVCAEGGATVVVGFLYQLPSLKYAVVVEDGIAGERNRQVWPQTSELLELDTAYSDFLARWEALVVGRGLVETSRAVSGELEGGWLSANVIQSGQPDLEDWLLRVTDTLDIAKAGAIDYPRPQVWRHFAAKAWDAMSRHKDVPLLFDASHVSRALALGLALRRKGHPLEARLAHPEACVLASLMSSLGRSLQDADRDALALLVAGSPADVLAHLPAAELKFFQEQLDSTVRLTFATWADTGPGRWLTPRPPVRLSLVDWLADCLRPNLPLVRDALYSSDFSDVFDGVATPV